MAGFLASVTTVVHFLALLYIGLGGFLAWRWPRSIFVHVLFAGWGALVVSIDALPCPLTAVEDYFRGLQGLGPLPGGFNEYYIYGELIPESLLPVVGIGAVLALLVSYIGVYVRWRSRAHQDDTNHQVRLG
ncbi:DUF2784 domain-containing protein [Amycolatopsis cihanbeyliensis]|uniref:Uncharacterized protein DUF2784 n=1 Tax=Amycolatopsis cihanbeyliensis TaxID=1128664 RepID=A0A542DKQ1_AMYCI|nr:DUF2784 domain-containing protein [Amycolatopsis cihanbeyliensis]TQJ03643.1 uncharacterized protein DUF2784 [Amycolatopsis cihanbeyliensis]